MESWVNSLRAPVNKEQFVLMVPANHLTIEEKLSSLLSLCNGSRNETYFVGKHHLASYPALSQENLKKDFLTD